MISKPPMFFVVVPIGVYKKKCCWFYNPTYLFNPTYTCLILAIWNNEEINLRIKKVYIFFTTTLRINFLYTSFKLLWLVSKECDISRLKLWKCNASLPSFFSHHVLSTTATSWEELDLYLFLFSRIAISGK